MDDDKFDRSMLREVAGVARDDDKQIVEITLGDGREMTLSRAHWFEMFREEGIDLGRDPWAGTTNYARDDGRGTSPRRASGVDSKGVMQRRVPAGLRTASYEPVNQANRRVLTKRGRSDV